MSGWPEANATREQHWTPISPFARSSRYFCCGTAQRALYACPCLRLPKDPKESWPTCQAHISESRREVGAPCLVYSFGIAMQWEFDDHMASLGCEVHSFDPTGAYVQMHYAHNQRGVTFHPWGLSRHQSQSCSHDARRFVGGTYVRRPDSLIAARIILDLTHLLRPVLVIRGWVRSEITTACAGELDWPADEP